MSAHPCADHRNALEIRLGAATEGLAEHLAHEETRALPMLQRTLSEDENRSFEQAVEKSYPLRMVPFLLPWAMDEVPDEARDRLLETPPRLQAAAAPAARSLRTRRTPRVPLRLTRPHPG